MQAVFLSLEGTLYIKYMQVKITNLLLLHPAYCLYSMFLGRVSFFDQLSFRISQRGHWLVDLLISMSNSIDIPTAGMSFESHHVRSPGRVGRAISSLWSQAITGVLHSSCPSLQAIPYQFSLCTAFSTTLGQLQKGRQHSLMYHSIIFWLLPLQSPAGRCDLVFMMYQINLTHS